MSNTKLIILAVVFLVPRVGESAQPRTVLEVARSYKDGGGYVWESGTGAPREIRVNGALLLPAQKKGTYCSGFTFSVAMEAATERGLVKDKKLEAVRQFQKEWYGVPKEAAEMQCALAVERLGVGKRVTKLEDARPSDFVQLWRTNKSGHSVVLVELVRDRGKIIGLTYRSSQKSTDGIGERTEYFADVPGKGGKLDRTRIYVARLNEK